MRQAAEGASWPSGRRDSRLQTKTATWRRALVMSRNMYAQGGQAPRSQVRRPRVAQVVASALRDQILTGALRDGGALPKQEDLLEEFNVSLPSLREALSILETEG